MWIQTLVLMCHLLLAMAIIGLVLLQRGKGAEAGTGFGAGASGTVFGARGSASFFSRATAVLATLFFATSLALAYFATQTSGTESLVGGASGEDAAEAVQEVRDADPAIVIPGNDGAAEAPAVEAAPSDVASGEGSDQ
jgi:preprotein translocase subunit SecG